MAIFMDDCPDASYEDVLLAFGSPAAMAAEMLCDIPEQEISGTARQKTRLRRAWTAALLMVSICACVAVAYCIRKPRTVEITTVIDYTDELPSYWDYAEKYGINYEYDASGRIVQATDNNGNEIKVDKDGIPVDKEKYSLKEERKRKN